MHAPRVVIVLGLFVLVGCAGVPKGPTVAVYVGKGKSYDTYKADSAVCRQEAHEEVTRTFEPSAIPREAKTAALTGALGTAAGAVIGAVTGSPGSGAAIGAAAGTTAGAAIGVNRGDRQQLTAQQIYNNAYAVCMAAYQHQVPSMPLMRP